MELNNQVALVTGGASGLGLATARALAARGAHVVIADLPTSPHAAALAELGNTAVFCATNVRDDAEVVAAVDKATTLGPLRVAVNCAGIAISQRVLGRGGPHSSADFERVVATNLLGTFNVTRLAAAAMSTNDDLDGDRGILVMTASVAAYDGQIGQAAYAASKAAVAGMTLPLARDLAGHHIRVVTVAPGLFATPMVAGLPEDAQASLAAQVPHPSRLGDPSEYASLVLHVIDNPMINGETIRLDGSIRMGPR